MLWLCLPYSRVGSTVNRLACVLLAELNKSFVVLNFAYVMKTRDSILFADPPQCRGQL